MIARSVLLISSIMSAGLVAGLFFGWMVSVIPGTQRVDDRTYVTTMQSINVAIVNPAFVIPFLLTPFALLAAAFFEYRSGHHRRGVLLASAAGVYIVGVLAVTFGGNIPLNNALDAFDLESAPDDAIATQRADYEGPWNRWHAVRTVAAVVAFGIATASTLALADSE